MFENLVIKTLAPVVNKIPSVDLSNILNQPGVSTFIDYLDAVTYFLPWSTVAHVVSIIISLYAIRVFVAFFKMLWGILPAV